MIKKHALRHAARCLSQGGLIAYPTEAVYGLGCDPHNPIALSRLLALKQRRADKGLILIAANLSQLQPYINPLSPTLKAQLSTHWPGPYTWILPARLSVSPQLRGKHGGIAVRISAHAQSVALCRAFGGAIVSTSANKSGKPALRDAQAVRQQLGPGLDYILSGKTDKLANPSQIWDSFSGKRLR